MKALELAAGCEQKEQDGTVDGAHSRYLEQNGMEDAISKTS